MDPTFWMILASGISAAIGALAGADYANEHWRKKFEAMEKAKP